MIHAMMATIGVFLGLAAVVALFAAGWLVVVLGGAFLKVIFGVK